MLSPTFLGLLGVSRLFAARLLDVLGVLVAAGDLNHLHIGLLGNRRKRPPAAVKSGNAHPNHHYAILCTNLTMRIAFGSYTRVQLSPSASSVFDGDTPATLCDVKRTPRGCRMNVRRLIR